MSTGAGSRRWPVIGAAAAALLAAALYLSFDLGRYRAGFARLDARRERAALEARTAELSAANEELSRQLAILATSREIDRETYAQIKETLDQQQRQIQAQEEELAFYRGIVSPGDGATDLRVQDLEILPGDSEQRFWLRLILVQAIVHDRQVSGTVKVRLSGTLDGAPAELDLARLVEAGEPGEIAYEFRYFQRLDQALVLPVGFEPDTVGVEIWPREPRGEPVERRFPWLAGSR